MPTESNLDQELKEIIDTVTTAILSEGRTGYTRADAVKAIKGIIYREKFKYIADVISDMFMAKTISEDDYDNWTKRVTEEFEVSSEALYNTEENVSYLSKNKMTGLREKLKLAVVHKKSSNNVTIYELPLLDKDIDAILDLFLQVVPEKRKHNPEFGYEIHNERVDGFNQARDIMIRNIKGE